jgi:hypothetical protein
MACVRQTIDQELPREADFLQRFDQFCVQVFDIVDMPNRTVELLFRFLNQNEGRLSKRARQREFAALDDAEVARIERIFQAIVS